jgi:DNA-binding NarL/FixJ family response regulator
LIDLILLIGWLDILCEYMDATYELIVVADDPLVRAGLAALLGPMPGFSVAAQGSGDLLFAVGEIGSSVDVVVWDMGWEAREQDEEDEFNPGASVLALVPDEVAAGVAWRLGCRAILSRQSDEDQLAAAIVAVAEGLLVISPALSALLTVDKAGGDAPPTDLTPREIEVLALLAEGLTNKAIAHRLSISDHTVKFHVNAILNKLEAQSRTDAVVRGTRLGLIAL